MLRLINVSKKYHKNNKETFYAVNNVSYEFKNNGFYFLYGKSGSGKSTLANMIASYETIDEGYIEYNNVLVNKLKNKQLNYYRSQVIGMIFQHYNLIENNSVYENIYLSKVIAKTHDKNAENQIDDLLKKFNLFKLKNKKVADLSGGEKQRVAIIRAIINNPKIILADEPTGALDEENSINVINILKELSKNHIVIVISHNYDLIMLYADEMINIDDGKIKENNDKLKPRKQYEKFKINKTKSSDIFFVKEASKNLIKNKIKNTLILFSTCFSLIIMMCIFGFLVGSNDFIENQSNRRLDYSLSTISKIETITVDNSFLNLNRMERLNDYEIEDIVYEFDYLTYEINITKLFEGASFYFFNEIIDSASLSYVYNFNTIDNSLLITGEISLEEGVYINKNLEEKLLSQHGINSVIGRTLQIKNTKEFVYELEDTTEDNIDDTFVFDKTYYIKGVVDEFSFLSTPKIYLSYQDLIANLQTNLALNISTYLDFDYSWYDYIYDIDNNDASSSYSHYLFLTNLNYLHEYETFINDVNDTYDYIEISCDGIILKDTFNDIIYAVKIGLIVFSCLIILSAVLIIGISSFSSFAFNRKKNAILLALGINHERLFNIYIFENLILLLLGLILSFALIFLVQPLANLIIENIFGLSNLINIPFSSFLNIKFLMPILIILGSLFIIYFATYIPIYISRNINIRKELADE